MVKEAIIDPRKYVPNIACRVAQYVLDPIPNFEENLRFFCNISRRNIHRQIKFPIIERRQFAINIRKIPNILQIFFIFQFF